MARTVSKDCKDHADILRRELAAQKCIGLPTETVYGLAADATDGIAVARIFEMKQRPSFNPLICHVADREMAEKYGVFDPVSMRLAEVFWPGPLTIVVPLKPDSGLHPLVSAGLGTAGFRCPQGPARDIIGQYGKPLAAPSANPSGKLSPTRAQHVVDAFADSDLVILDNGPCQEGVESTIVRADKGEIVILRPGSITREMIETGSRLPTRLADGDKIEAPGMMKSHYAPDAKVLLDCSLCPPGTAWLQFGPVAAGFEGQSLNLSTKSDLREAAANLYDYLKQLDLPGVSAICVSPIPEEGLGVAINDRLRRAAAPRN